MRYVRKWVYKLGFRPKRGSIFYSPSLHYSLAAKRGMKYMVLRIQESSTVDRLRSREYSKHFQRLFTIRIYRARHGWVWSDWAGWGPDEADLSLLKTLYRAVRG